MKLILVNVSNEMLLFRIKSSKLKSRETKNELDRLQVDIQSDLNGADIELTTNLVADLFVDKAKSEGIELVKVDIDAQISFDISGPVLCQYCGAPNGSDDEDLLCQDCRETFGHSLFSEL